jgi:TolB-like protein/class 3 adenylate cyclase/Flp pilus assembly protein TadD
MLQTETRKLAAIMFTDIVGFSRQMGADEARMLRLLAVHNQLIERAVAAHHGQVIKSTGDGFLAEFPSVVHAVQCAQAVQIQFRAYNDAKERAEQIHIRIGIHLGDIVVQPDGDVQGDGVNVAARLQPLAEPDTICLSGKVYEEVEKKIPLGPVISLGRPKLKNIAQRFPVYLLVVESPQGIRQTLHVQRLKLSRHLPSLGFALVSILLFAGLALFLSPSRPPLRTQDSAPKTNTAPAALPLPDKPSIVVLPFDNMSKDPEQDYFSNGITEILTSDLSHISGLFVIARNTAFTYRGKATNVQEIGKELGVRYVLEGSVQKAADQVRIVAQLVNATTGGHVWSERYDRPLKDIFALQDEIVQKIVTTLKLQLSLQEQGILARKTTDNLEAYDYYLRGMEYFIRFTKETNVQARQMYERAVALDPAYAEAYAGLGWNYYIGWSFRWSADPQTLEQALALARKALALDGSLSSAHNLLGFVYVRKQQYDQALVESERAIALDPNNAEGYAARAQVLLFAGRAEDAVPSIEQALRLNPHAPVTYLMTLGQAYQGTGRFEEAIAVYKQLLVRNPNFLWAYPNLAFGYLAQWGFQQSSDSQTLEQALETAQRGVALNDSLPIAHMALGYTYLAQKQYDQAIAEMERAIALDPNLANGYAFLAEVLSRVGRSKDALQMVEQALRLKPLSADNHLNSVGVAYYLAGRPEEAVAPLQRFLSHYRHALGAHLTLAAVYSELGKEAEAQAEAAEVLRINPQFSLEVLKQRAPIKDPVVLERYVAALREAGLR